MITRLVITLALVATIVGLLLPAIGEKRLDRQVRSCLLTLQEALQKYHVAEERYPTQSPLSGTELSTLLSTSGHLETVPRNPWTGLRYDSDADLPANADRGSDRIVYTTDELAETYTLKALRVDSDEIHHVIDSTEHPSLE